MKKPHEQSNQDISGYQSMSDEELTELLLRDIRLPEEEESNTDEIISIVEEVVKRKEEQSSSEIVDVDAAWESFQQRFLAASGDADALCQEKEERNKKQASNRWKHAIWRFACVAAVFAVILLTNTITASAFGNNLWGTVAEWTKGTFGFHSEGTIIKQNDEITSAFSINQVNEKLVPSWFPEGYRFDEIEVNETLRATIFQIKYSSEESDIWITIRKLEEPTAVTYEKDDNEVIMYEAGGIKHYIMTDIGIRKIVWAIQEYECNITGDFSLQDAKRIINSIYKEK